MVSVCKLKINQTYNILSTVELLCLYVYFYKTIFFETLVLWVLPRIKWKEQTLLCEIWSLKMVACDKIATIMFHCKADENLTNKQNNIVKHNHYLVCFWHLKKMKKYSLDDFWKSNAFFNGLVNLFCVHTKQSIYNIIIEYFWIYNLVKLLYVIIRNNDVCYVWIHIIVLLLLLLLLIHMKMKQIDLMQLNVRKNLWVSLKILKIKRLLYVL